MTLSSTIALLIAMTVLALIPGPGVFTVMARSMLSGFKHGFATALGILTGDFVFILLTVFGLLAVAEAMGELFVVVKYLGAAYLLYLGYQMFTTPIEQHDVQGVKENAYGANYIAGLFVTLGNPKAILFYLGFFPTFMDLKTIDAFDVLTVLIVATISVGGVMVSYAYLASHAKTLFQTRRAKKLLNYSAGSIMIAGGTALAVRA